MLITSVIRILIPKTLSLIFLFVIKPILAIAGIIISIKK
jgi:hypothetical protein